MPVVLGSGWPGILLHEAIGHGLEGDFNRKGTSAFTGRIGERVATEQCTVVDDGTLVGRRGSLTVDDEGTPTRCNTLIERGVLKGYMFDKMNARLMGVKSTGNGRRESFAHAPMPRMTNTYMLPGQVRSRGDHRVDRQGDLRAEFRRRPSRHHERQVRVLGERGIPRRERQEDRARQGRDADRQRPEVLTRVSMVGNDLKLDAGLGTCGKDGQSVPVGVGQPTIRIDSLTVGGTQA